MQPNESYIFPVSSNEYPTLDYLTGFIANPATSPTPTPTVPEFPALTIPILLIVMAIAGLSVYFKKHRQIMTSQT